MQSPCSPDDVTIKQVSCDQRWLARAQLLVVLAQRPHALAEGGGLIVLPGGAQLGGKPAAQAIVGFTGPFDDVKGIESDLRLRGLFRITSWIHSAPSAHTCVSSLARTGPRASRNARTLSWQRPSPIHAT